MEEVSMLRQNQLEAGHWYVGRGRNSNVGFWDGSQFVVLGRTGIRTGHGPREWVSTWAVKYEDHFDEPGGCFQPFRKLDEGETVVPYGERDYARTIRFSDN